MSLNILPFRIDQILSEHTDGDHALPMRELLRLLRMECGLRCDRRAVYAALDKLRMAGCHIPEYADDGEGYRLLSRPLEPSEVRLLSDAASAFPGISQRQCQRLLEKLRRGLSRWQREQCCPLPVEAPWRGATQEAMWEEAKSEYGLDITEEASRTEMLAEAAERMKTLGLPEDAIREFRNSGQPRFRMENGQCFPLSNDEKKQIQTLEGNEERLVYAVIRNDSRCGRLTNFIMVSRYSHHS